MNQTRSASAWSGLPGDLGRPVSMVQFKICDIIAAVPSSLQCHHTSSERLLLVRMISSSAGIVPSRPVPIRLQNTAMTRCKIRADTGPGCIKKRAQMQQQESTNEMRLLCRMRVLRRLSSGKPSSLRMSFSDRSIVSNWSCSRGVQLQ